MRARKLQLLTQQRQAVAVAEKSVSGDDSAESSSDDSDVGTRRKGARLGDMLFADEDVKTQTEDNLKALLKQTKSKASKL